MASPIKLSICSWARGIGAGAARMESYYHRFLNRDAIEPKFISLVERKKESGQYDSKQEYVELSRQNRFQALLEEFKDQDIVQFQGGFDPLVCEAARVSGVPVLVEVIHNIEPGGFFSNIDLSICVSGAITKLQPNSEKAVSILNGIDVEDFPFGAKSKDSSKIVLLQVGNRAKTFVNLDELADRVLPLDPRIEIWLAGHGQDKESTERVKFLGVREDIAEIYRQADLMVLLSREEPFGLAAIEAMSSGCLPLVTEAGGFVEIVRDGEDGWLTEVGDEGKAVAKIAEAIGAFGSESWEAMRLSGRERVEKRFDARKTVAAYQEKYLELVAAKGRRAHIGPTGVEPSIEALLGEALFFFQEQDSTALHTSCRKIAEHEDSFELRFCSDVASQYALVCESHQQAEIALAVARKVQSSGHASQVALSILVRNLPDEEIDSVIVEVLRFSGSSEELVLALAERLVRMKRKPEAIGMLQSAVANTVGNSESVERYIDWIRRLEETP